MSSIAFPMDETVFGIPLALGVGGTFDRLSRAKSELTQAVRATIAEFTAECREEAVYRMPPAPPVLMEMAQAA